jgi:hypothetical protein
MVYKLVAMLLVSWPASCSVKDEKDLLKAIEHLVHEPLTSISLQRDPFSWPILVHNVSQSITKPKQAVKPKAPSLGWSLTGISLTKRGNYALFADGKTTKLAKANEQLGNGWRVASIENQKVICKHQTGAARELIV